MQHAQARAKRTSKKAVSNKCIVVLLRIVPVVLDSRKQGVIIGTTYGLCSIVLPYCLMKLYGTYPILLIALSLHWRGLMHGIEDDM